MGLMNKPLLLSLAFIEGACVMAIELLGAKMIAPFFGSSLYVWASVLGVTLFSLMMGYYLGGFFSEKSKSKNAVLWVLIAGGTLITLMPYSSLWIMKNMIDSSIQVGSTISLIVFLLPPLVFMGMTSPMLINLINSSVDKSGKTAGLVYAISTLGGIFGTFLIGFYLLPNFGINWPCLIFGGIIMIVPIILLIKKNFIKTAACLIPFFTVLFLNSSATENTHRNISLLYESEGVLGQIKIYDMPYRTNLQGMKKGRLLMVNNTAQTIGNVDDKTRDLWDYSYYFPSALSTFPKGSDALLLGLGGGSLVHHFDRLKFKTDVVELDQRVKDVAINYFGVRPETTIVVDDARHYLNICKKKYNVIMMDLFLNETPPAHVLTKESFNKAKSLLKKDGVIMINFYGYITGEKGLAARSIFKTLKSIGLDVKILPTPGIEAHRNLIFIAGNSIPDLNLNSYELPDLPKLVNLNAELINTSEIDFSSASILIDAKPELEKMYLSAALDWRATSIEYNLKMLLEEDFVK